MFFIIFFGVLSISEGIQVTPQPPRENFPDLSSRYYDYSEMTQFLKEIANNHSELATLYSIGQTVEHRELWVLKIKAPGHPVLGVPNIKFVGNIHGNEPVGRQLILYFAQYLVKNYYIDDEVNWILNKTIIHLLPSMNPDGFEKSKEGDCYSGPGRENGNLVDLNRSFPDYFNKNNIPPQPETIAIRQWMTQVPFVLSASFHGGALVANYPFDSSPRSEQRELLLASPSAATPDDDVFRYLAQTYSSNHLTMHKGRTCNQNQPFFFGGITNGAAWYEFTGGMQDYNYIYHGCMELTLEISCCKYPQAGHLPRLWNENKRAILELAKQAQMGVRGLILDKLTSNYIPGARLQIADRKIGFTSSQYGEFWRILLPGDYILIADADGYESQSFPFSVPNFNASYPTYTWLNIYLQPVGDMLTAESSTNLKSTTNSGSSHSLSFLSSFSLLILCFVYTIKNFL